MGTGRNVGNERQRAIVIMLIIDIAERRGDNTTLETYQRISILCNRESPYIMRGQRAKETRI